MSTRTTSACRVLLYLVCIQLDILICCPPGYDWCNSEDGGTCPTGATEQDHGEVAFGTDADGYWSYKSLSTSNKQRDCTEVEFGDISNTPNRECCITNLTDPIAANVVGEMSCGDTTKVWFRDEINKRHWKLTTTEMNDITYYGCNTGFDSTTTVYDASETVISDAECPPNMDGYGNDCGSCSASNTEEFTLTNQVAGVYWIRIAYFNTTSANGNRIYELTITCSPTTYAPTTSNPTTPLPTTSNPTTTSPTTTIPTTSIPTTFNPTTTFPTTNQPTSAIPTTYTPTTEVPSTLNPTTSEPSTEVTTSHPTDSENGGSVKTSTTLSDSGHRNTSGHKKSGLTDSILLIWIGILTLSGFILLIFLIFICYYYQKKKKEKNLMKNIEVDSIERVLSVEMTEPENTVNGTNNSINNNGEMPQDLGLNNMSMETPINTEQIEDGEDDDGLYNAHNTNGVTKGYDDENLVDHVTAGNDEQIEQNEEYENDESDENEMMYQRSQNNPTPM